MSVSHCGNPATSIRVAVGDMYCDVNTIKDISKQLKYSGMLMDAEFEYDICDSLFISLGCAAYKGKYINKSHSDPSEYIYGAFANVQRETAMLHLRCIFSEKVSTSIALGAGYMESMGEIIPPDTSDGGKLNAKIATPKFWLNGSSKLIIAGMGANINVTLDKIIFDIRGSIFASVQDKLSVLSIVASASTKFDTFDKDKSDDVLRFMTCDVCFSMSRLINKSMLLGIDIGALALSSLDFDYKAGQSLIYNEYIMSYVGISLKFYG